MFFCDLNRVVHPSLPYVAIVPNGMQPGKAVILKGLVLAGKGKDFGMNLTCGLLVDGDHLDNIALHFNPRFSEDQVVLNTLVNNKWGIEERHPMPFRQGQAFEIRLLALTDVYKIAVNGRHFCDYRHRISLSDIRAVYLRGCIQVDVLEFQGEQEADAGNAPIVPVENINVYSGAPGLGLHASLAAAVEDGPPKSTPIIKPPIPYTTGIPGGQLTLNRQIHLTGTPKLACCRFSVNFLSGLNIAFHFNVRFDEHLLVRNSFRIGRWGKEEVDTPHFPFVQGGTFDLIFLCDHDGFKVAVNGAHMLEFCHRIPFQEVDSMRVDGDVSVQQLHILPP